MNPWLVATGDFTTLGGMDRANHALAAHLARREMPVHLVAHRIAPDLTACPHVRTHLVPRPFGAHLVGAPLLARAASREARTLGRSARVIMNGGNGAIGTPTWVHYLHAAYEPQVAASVRTRLSAAAGRRYYLARERAALASAPLVICNSERTARDVREHYGVPASRIKVVYYGSDARAFSPVTAEERAAARAALGIEDGRFVAVFVGALGDRRKGFDVVFDAWRALSADRAWDIDLLAIGAGAEAPVWAARARAVGLERRIRLLGFRDDVSRVLAAADVLVHPVRYEAYGLGVHEAICRGLPAIVTGIAGVTERYPASLGSLIIGDPPSADALATALQAWRAHASEWRARIAQASQAFRARSWDDMAADIVAAVDAAA
jgi:glycosyltransferase involved in cell wall biosynthesis